MENKQVMSKEEAKEAAKDFLEGVELVLALLEVKCPGNKSILLDAMIEGLEELDGRTKECCAGAGCQPDRAVGNSPVPSGLSFGDALSYLKADYKVARKGWNGKGQYVELAECISYRNRAGNIVNAEHQAIGNRALAFVGTSGVQLGWLASQADMLAEDWCVVE